MSNQSKSGSQEHEDQTFVSEAYQQLSKAKPADAVDANILSAAKQQAALNSVSSQGLTKSPWRKWQYSGSIAASVMLVTIVFFVAEPDLETDKVQSLDRPSIAPAPQMADETNEGIATATASSEIEQIVLNRSRRVASSVNTEAESSEKTSIEELFTRLLAFKTRDGELLQSKQSIRSALTEIDKSELKSTKDGSYFADESEVNVLQKQLFDALYAAKQADPKWELNNKYKEVLTQEQIKRLSTKNMVIENTQQQ